MHDVSQLIGYVTKLVNEYLCQSGLTPLHLVAQEDKVNVSEVLVNHGATIDPETKVMTSHTQNGFPYFMGKFHVQNGFHIVQTLISIPLPSPYP